VDPQNGKFRSFLLASLRNYLSNGARSAGCLKRGAHVEFVHLDILNLQNAENRYDQEEPFEALTPEKIFDARWAMPLLGEASRRLSLEYSAEGKATTFEALIELLDPFNTQDFPSYEEVANQLKVSVGAVKTLIHRMRKRNTALVREEIVRTVSDPAGRRSGKSRALRSSDRRGRTDPATKWDSGASQDDSADKARLAEREIRTCSVCGTKFSTTTKGVACPVCILRGVVSGGSAVARTVNRAAESKRGSEQGEPDSSMHRFENYKLMLDEAGRPIELGRGAMGITYKAFDADLRCPVTLKVISERCVGDGSARRRFLREARAAASLHHPNVASVFHLGRSGTDYFYAMEFVEGETLESLIKRSGHLNAKLALEITTQVGPGLTAVHQQKLVW